jgi:PBP1b-binding outer membrane lipoprotein LpoB
MHFALTAALALFLAGCDKPVPQAEVKPAAQPQPAAPVAQPAPEAPKPDPNKELAARAAYRVPGVTAVDNKLAVVKGS